MERLFVLEYNIESGKSSPSEILEVLESFHAEGRPIWKPMHLQPVYSSNSFVAAAGNGGAAWKAGTGGMDVSSDLFGRGICLPSDNKMTEGQQETVIELIRRCFS